MAFTINNNTFLTDIMESRNLVTANEMVNDGHWILPTMNGKPRLEKPPLPTWIAAITQKYVSEDLGAMRFIPGVMGLFMLFFFYRTTHLLSGRENLAFYASLILSTSYSVILMSRTVTWDIYCHAFMMAAIYYLSRLFMSVEHRYRNSLLAGLMLGLSLMSKGPVSFYALLLPFLVAFFLFHKIDRRGLTLPTILMIVVMLIVGGTWYGYVWLHEAQVGGATLAKESGSWVNRNVRPWYYYSTFFTETGCWALLCITTFLIPYWNKRLETLRRPYVMAFVWMIAVVFFLSLLPEKKNRYLLPMVIPASFTMAFIIFHWITTLHESSTTKSDRLIYRINGGLLTLALLIVTGGCVFMMVRGMVDMVTGICLTVVLVVITVILLLATIKLEARHLLAGVVLLFACVELAGMPVVCKIFFNSNYTSLRSLNNNKALDGLKMYNNGADDLRIEMVYDAKRKIAPLNYGDSATIVSKAPCILLSHKPLQQELQKNTLKAVSIKDLGVFDGNRHRKGTHGYRDMFIYHASLLTLKK
jgi:4-amino-4-deoxy-L-arabinose transferase-like glycosyltransferase